MVSAIGMRVSPTEITFAIAGRDGDTVEVRAVDAVTVPPALDLPDQLRFVRTTMLDVIEEFDVIRAGLKLVEHTAHGRHEFRLNLEGVLQEMLASSPVERYFAGRIDRLTFLLGEQSRPLVKQYIRGQQPFDRVPTWDQYRRVEVRESVLAAIAALQL